MAQKAPRGDQAAPELYAVVQVTGDLHLTRKPRWLMIQASNKNGIFIEPEAKHGEP